MFDWATVWPIITVVMKFLGILRCRDRRIDSACNSTAAVPQASGDVLPDTEDYDEYLEKMKEKEAQKA
ncbi:MAG: hypothetical protein V8S30_05220 [Merdibacter sp.]